ncbi:MAG: ABC transporter ATP-binding protein [Dehalococcoidia bacterium]
MHFPIKSGGFFRKSVSFVKAIDGVSLNLEYGETLGLVGESGSGKTTTGKCILKLHEPTSGDILFEGSNIVNMKNSDLRAMRQKVQFIFQDPYSSLNPRMTCEDIIGEPLKVHNLISSKFEYRNKVSDLLMMVGLNPFMADRYPHELSGGQRQRIGIARALAVEPKLIICDEPVSALDVSIQAQIINLLKSLQSELSLSFLFIAHDLAVVKNICDRIAVMYLGHIVEIAKNEELYENPLHPYTKALLSAVPIPDPIAESKRERISLKGEIPSPVNPPRGCTFHTRCPIAISECRESAPELLEITENHWVSCIRV